MALLKIMSQQIFGMTEENYAKHQSGQPLSGPGYIPGICRIRGESTNLLTMMLNV